MGDFDIGRSMAIEERHERHFYPAADGQHLFENGRCLCRPRTRVEPDKTIVYLHTPLGGGQPMDEHRADAT